MVLKLPCLSCSDVEYLRRLLAPEKCKLFALYPVEHDMLRLLPMSTKRLLNLTVSNAGVRLSQLCQRLAVGDDFPKTIASTRLISQRRSDCSSALDALPVGERVPRVILAAPQQPIFDVLIQQPVDDSDSDGPPSTEVTIWVQCKWSTRQDQLDGDVRSWARSTNVAAGTAADLSSSSSASAGASAGAGAGALALSPDPVVPRDAPNRLYVYFAARRVTVDTHAAVRSGELSNACILLLDLTSLTLMYGPSIARCHVFAMQLDAAEVQTHDDDITASLANFDLSGRRPAVV